VIDVDDGIAEQGADLRARADAVADLDGEDLRGFDLVPQGAKRRFRLSVVRRDQEEVAFLLDGIGVQGPEVDPGVGQCAQDPAENARLVRGDDVKLGFDGDDVPGGTPRCPGIIAEGTGSRKRRRPAGTEGFLPPGAAVGAT